MRQCYPLLIIALVWILRTPGATAQVSVSPHPNTSRQHPFHHIYKITASPRTTRIILLPVAATSIALQMDNSQVLSNAYIISGKDTFLLTEDIHARESSATGLLTSNLVIFSGMINTLELYSGDLSGEITMHLLNAGESRIEHQPYRSEQSASDCTRPATIGQHIWRAGLPAPAQLPEATAVAHLIVHHSATSNTITDYTAAVRNIYLYHRRKWLERHRLQFPHCSGRNHIRGPRWARQNRRRQCDGRTFLC
jgi:hypothetical protein